MKFSHLLVAAALCLAWGFNNAAAKIGVTYIPPVFFTALRFSVLLVLLFPWLKPVGNQGPVLIGAVFFMGALHFALIFTGAKLSSASAMAIVNQIYVPLSALIAYVWLGEAVPLRRWLGIGLAFVGVAIFSFDPHIVEHWAGVAFLLLDGVSMAIGTVLLRKLSGISAFTMQAWMAALGVPLLMLASFVFEHGQLQALASAPWQGWAALAYTVVIASLVGHTSYYFLLQRYEVSLVGAMVLLSPAIGVLSGVLLLHEPMTPEIFVGAVLTLAGVAVVLRVPKRGLAVPS